MESIKPSKAHQTANHHWCALNGTLVVSCKEQLTVCGGIDFFGQLCDVHFKPILNRVQDTSIAFI